MLRKGIIFKTLGLLLMLFSSSYLLPILVSLIYNDGHGQIFAYSLLTTLSVGTLIWLPFSRQSSELRVRDGFMITVLFWMVLGLAGALPFSINQAPDISLTDAAFEAISGLTTTGATSLSNLAELPPSLLFYRQLLQWMGGIGIVVIAVAVLPMLGVGGMQLYRAETPGPVKDSKLTPRIAETAKALFLIYVGLTATCTLAYWAAGMTALEAINHAFSTVSIGGFSTYDQSIGHFARRPDVHYPAILIICMAFMLISGLNFALHYYAILRRSARHYGQDSEAKTFFRIMLAGVILVVGMLYFWEVYDFSDSLREGAFMTISTLTTTGFTTTQFASWPEQVCFFLISLSFLGACAGSTGGGMKIGRIMILGKQTLREITRLIHPSAVMPIKVGKRPVNPRVADAIWGFLGAYLLIFNLMVLILLACGLDYVTAWSAVAAALNNLGPGLGDVASHYGDINSAAKWILCFCMILGRLELFTLIVLLSPAYWRN